MTESYSFTSNGKYLPDEYEKVTYEGGLLKKIEIGTDKTEYIYKNGRLQNKNFFGDFWGMPVVSMYIYTYDDNGLIIEKVCKSTGGDLTTKYSNYELDSKGNWIKRIYRIGDGLPVGEFRKIIYY